MPFRVEYNGCKTYGCPNCGQQDLSIYSRSNRLGYDAWHCPECGAFPPVLSNQPIIELAQQIKREQFDLAIFDSCDCLQPQLHRYGFTASGSQRVKCAQCQQVVTLPNVEKLSKQLQPIMDALIKGVTPDNLQKVCKLSNKAFSQRITMLANLLTYASRQWEANFSLPLIQTRTCVQTCRSGFQHHQSQQRETYLWTVSSADARSGYMLLINDNALSSQSSLLSEALPSGIYKLDAVEQKVEDDEDVLSKAEKTYSKIMARSQFDMLAYAEHRHALSKEALIFRPVYAAHAHFQNLRQKVISFPPQAIVLEHESFLRGAAITAFCEEVSRDQTALFYCHVQKQMPNSKSTAMTKTMSWWNEKWYRLFIDYAQSYWHVGIGVLTNKQFRVEQLFPSHPNWNQYFWHEFNGWLSPEYARRISLKRLHQWQDIYRYFFNLVFDDRLEVGNKLGVMPAEISSVVESLCRQKAAPLQSLGISRPSGLKD